ncbi:MAG: hypothetical protein J7501_04315 [Bdellovibrio sp.]|nr:hypothetical protein [Bdellovibrio sp.]
MEYVETACRWIFALQMIFWGLNGFFHWLPIPPASPVITRFVDACIETKFIMPTVKTVEVLFGILLLVKIAVPLSLFFFAPIVFVITLLHLMHNPKPWPVIMPITLPFAVVLGFHAQTLLASSF